MSQLNVNNVARAAGGTETNLSDGLAKARIQLDMNTSTVNETLNVASTTDNGVGDWTVNFTNNFNSAYYSGGAWNGNVVNHYVGGDLYPTASSCVVTSYNTAASAYADSAGVGWSGFGDLA